MMKQFISLCAQSRSNSVDKGEGHSLFVLVTYSRLHLYLIAENSSRMQQILINWCPRKCSSVSWCIVHGNLNKICIIVMCESCINLIFGYSNFQVYYILLVFCLLIILLIFLRIWYWNSKILIYLYWKIIVICNGTICNFVLYFPSLL